MENKQLIERLFDLGHFYAPDAVHEGLVTQADLDKLVLTDRVTQAAVRSWQSWFADDVDEFAMAHHRRRAIIDGDAGPATIQSLNKPRCGHPDYMPPNEAREEANWPEDCRRNITTSYKMTLRGLSDEDVARLWQEADMNWEREFDVGFVFQPQNYPNTRIYAFKANLGGSTLADQFLATNSCSFRSRGRFDNRTWNEVLLVTTITHEHGHALGLPHSRDRAATMYPSITQASMARRGKPNAADARNMLARGYKRRTTPLPPPPPPPKDPTDETFKIERNKLTHVPSGDSIMLRFIEDSGFVK